MTRPAVPTVCRREHGFQAIAIDYKQLEAHSILVKEYGPGVTPHFAEPVTGVVRINGATWTVYHRHFALRRTFSDGVTVMIEGDGYASTNALEILASGIR